MILFLLIASIALVVWSTYMYLLPYHRAEQTILSEQFNKSVISSAITPVIVELIESNDFDDDRPTVVAIPKHNK